MRHFASKEELYRREKMILKARSDSQLTEDARWRDAKLARLPRKFAAISWWVMRPFRAASDPFVIFVSRCLAVLESVHLRSNIQPSKEGHCTARELASSAQVGEFSMIFLPCPKTWANGVRYVLIEVVSGEIGESCHFFEAFFSSHSRP